MWNSEILNYIFSLAPMPIKPVTNTNGKVTIYRGMGAMSQSVDKAISWSTSSVNALYFANRDGTGKAFAVAEIDMEDIVWYDSGTEKENEIIVYPGTVKNYYYEDFIVSIKKDTEDLIAPTVGSFFMLKTYVNKLYAPERTFEYHGSGHINNVLMFSLIYIYNSKDPLSREDRSIMPYFSILHDIGRTNESNDNSHGKASVEYIKQSNISIPELPLSTTALGIAHLIIEYHSKDDAEGVHAINNSASFSRKNKRRALKLYKICKDMDALDRVRFHGLDYRMLRTQYAKRLPLVAGGIRFMK